MTEEEFVEEHIECTSNWVHSCAQYALQNFTYEVSPEDADDDTVREGRTVSDEYRDENESFFVDLRLRYHNGELFNHSGSSDYDQDHRGYSSASSVEWCATKEQAREIAKDMLTELFNEIPEGEEDESN